MAAVFTNKLTGHMTTPSCLRANHVTAHLPLNEQSETVRNCTELAKTLFLDISYIFAYYVYIQMYYFMYKITDISAYFYTLYESIEISGHHFLEVSFRGQH